MTAQTSHLRFDLNPLIAGRLTATWDVCSLQSNVLLGRISWYVHWRRYTYSPAGSQVLDAGCLRELAEFIEGKMKARVGEKVAEK